MRIAYGLISKGNGEVILSYEKHMTLSIGGGQAGQGYPCVFIFDARGNGGALCPTITGDHQNRITDYTAIVVHTPPQATDSTPKDLELSAQAVGTTGGSEMLIVENRGGVGLSMRRWDKPTSTTKVPIHSQQETTNNHRR